MKLKCTSPVTNPRRPGQRLSKVIKGTVLPTNSSVACAMFTVGCGQKQQFWTIQAKHRARVATDVPMSSQVIQVIPHVVGLTFSEPGQQTHWMTRNPHYGGSQTIQWYSVTAVHKITRHRLSTARVERIIVTAFLRVLRLLLLLLRLRLRCLAGAALCAECCHCTVCSVFLFFLFSLSPPLPFRLCGSLRPYRHREPVRLPSWLLARFVHGLVPSACVVHCPHGSTMR